MRRCELLPNSHAGTPWQQLYDSQSDSTFITTLRFDVQTFQYIIDCGFERLWDTTAIQRDDVSPFSIPRTNRRSLDAAGALGLALHYLTSSASANDLCLVFAIIPTTVQRYLDFSLSILASVLKSMPEGQISWPTDTDFEYFNTIITQRHPLLTGAFGAMDGLNLPLKESTDSDIENATYNGWLHAHFMSNVLVFSPTGKSVFIITNIYHSFILCRGYCPRGHQCSQQLT